MEPEAGALTASQPGTRLRVTNWLGDVVSYPAVVVEPASVEEVVAIVTDPERYPSPLRAHGSAHSTTRCLEAEGGTVVSMRRLDRILAVGEDAVTVEAGALAIDVAAALRERGLELFVNSEIGCLTMGSAACAGTKDGSLPGEYGQASSYCVGMKIVLPSGELLEVDQSDPELLQAARSSYGLFGIVVEATFRVRPIELLSVRYRGYGPAAFERALPGLVDAGNALMLFIYPSLDLVTAELTRSAGPASSGAAPRDAVWRIRNFAWKSVVPRVASLLARHVRSPRTRALLMDAFNRVVQRFVRLAIRSPRTTAAAQIIRYPAKASPTARFTFTFWAFPEERYLAVLREYFAWVAQYERATGYRPNVGNVGYRVAGDRSALLSYSWDGPVLTIDPVSTGDPGWYEFLAAFNEFCSERGGRPMLNQTWGLTPEQVRRAYGERLDRLEAIRRELDPGDRMLSDYFGELVAGRPPRASAGA